MAIALFEETLAQYAQELDLIGLRHDNIYGVCLEFDQKIEICMRWDNESDIVYAYIFCAYLPKAGTNVLFESLLSANFLWIDTGGATFSIDESTNSIFLINRWGREIYQSVELLKYSIDTMVNRAEVWIERIERDLIRTTGNIDNTHAYSYMDNTA